MQDQTLYPTAKNPMLIKPARSLPREVAIIGSGTIGPDIGYYLKSALPEIKLHLVDISETALKNAEKRIASYAQKGVDKKKMTPEKAEAVLKNISYTPDYDQIKGCQLIIEAATEDLGLKQKIFKLVEDRVSEEAILASNTSSIPAARIFAQARHPERTSITHFFAPAWRSLPVEIVTWDQSRQEVIDYLLWFFTMTGKVPLVTRDVVCFMLDRVFDNWCNEAALLLNEASASQVDTVSEEFVFAGPFFVLNLANGNPIIIETNTNQMLEEGGHYQPAPILASVEKWATARPGSGDKVPQEIRDLVRDRLLGILFSQSFDILDRRIGTKEDLNLGCEIGLGFKQGPLDLMQKLGQEEVKRVVERFALDKPEFPKPKHPLDEYLAFRRNVLVDDVDGVKVITLRRPQAMNALSDQINDEILSVLEQFQNDPETRGFVLTGYGLNVFSAGADIGKFPRLLGDKEGAARYSRECAKVQRFMDNMDKPIVAAVNGLALGGGLEMAIRCQDLVAVRQAGFQFPEITLGILPGIGGCVVPYRRWPKGSKLFHEMILFGKRISADQAKETGMVRTIVDSHQDLLPEAVRTVLALQGTRHRIPEGKVDLPEIELPKTPKAGKLPLSREAVEQTAATIKKAAAAESFEQALEIGYQGFGEIACLEAAKEGISAFLEKRKPEFKK
ncbi:MAG: 3-hydroxyacyl-CoA dehydrogenase/enoyl-CoA hydratase family protein [Desulfohalobiaceae bacterium]|nr:3-hydroxyacyl-CoA dehydrogenase/enoyl-CoA hydratase family protein [Desulfohalobiaceae bacterium]